MKRLLLFVAALTAAAGGLSACDASPYAAQVGGQVIKQTALMRELKAWAGAPGYVTEFNNSNSNANGGSGITVAGAAAGSTYNSIWVANQLNGMIEAAIIHQNLASTGNLPDQALLDAARSVSEIAESAFWYQLPTWFRDTLVERLAEQAALTQITTSLTTLKQAYQQYQSYFFSQVCVRQAFGTQADMQQISQSGNVGGVPVCYSQADFEQQSSTYQKTVMGLAVGQVSSPVQNGLGYEVVQVASRVQQPFGSEMQRVLGTVIAEAGGAGVAQVITQLVHTARVKVNPAFGSWHNGQVTPPTPPPSGQ